MKKSIRKNYFYNLAFQIVTILLPLITAPYLARILGVSGTGISSYTLSIVSYFILFGSIGVASYGQREIAMNRDHKDKYSRIFWELFIYKAITTIISIVAYVIFIFSQSTYNLIYWILSLNILASALDISWFFQGLEEYKMISIRNILVKLLFTISIFLFVRTANDLNLYILLNSLSLILSSIALWIHLPKYICKVSFRELKIFRHTKDTMIYFFPQIATQIYTVLDKTMLGIITGSEIENGYYEQAHKIINISLTIITSLNTVLSPRMAYLYKSNKKDELKNRLKQSLQFVSFLAVPMVFGLIAITPGFVQWFFGDGYEKVNILLPIFAPIILIIALSNCLGGQCLTPCGKRGKSAFALWAGAIVNFIVNLILIPYCGSVGAVIASVLAELIITLLYFYLSREYISIKYFFQCSWKKFVASVFMFLCLFYMVNEFNISVFATFFEIFVGSLIYFGVLFVLKDEFFINILKGVVNYGKTKFFKKKV